MRHPTHTPGFTQRRAMVTLHTEADIGEQRMIARPDCLKPVTPMLKSGYMSLGGLHFAAKLCTVVIVIEFYG